MRSRLKNFMTGRLGVDALNGALFAAVAALTLFAALSDRQFPYLLACIALVWALRRALSRDLARRETENRRFLAPARGARSRLASRRARRAAERGYKFFNCPGCGNRLRVPRGKGRLQITCPRCGQRFEGKT